MDETAHLQAMASGRGLVSALSIKGDRAAPLAQARHSIDQARAAVSADGDKDPRTRALAQSLIALGSAYRIFARAGHQADWRESRLAAERAMAEIAAIPGAAGSLAYAQVVRDANEVIAEAKAHGR